MRKEQNVLRKYQSSYSLWCGAVMKLCLVLRFVLSLGLCEIKEIGEKKGKLEPSIDTHQCGVAMRTTANVYTTII